MENLKEVLISFIALISKKVGVVEAKDFWPISLISGLYNIISKVVANRVSVVMSSIISKSKKAYVKGRQVLD